MESEVVRSQVHGGNDEPQLYNVASQQEEQQSDTEKKSVMNKVKAKAKKIKETIKKHGQYVLDSTLDNNSSEDHHYPPHHDMAEDEQAEDEQVDGAPVVKGEAVKSVPPTLEQVEDFVKTATPEPQEGKKTDYGGVNSGGDTTTVKEEEQIQQPRDVVGASPTTETNHDIATEPTKTIGEDKKQEQHFSANLEKPTGWDKEDPRTPENKLEAFTPPNYQTKATDSTETGNDELDIRPVEKSFERMNVQDEPEQVPEPKVMQYSAEDRYPSEGKHGEFAPKPEPEELSSETKTQNPSGGLNEQIVPEITDETESETQYPDAESGGATDAISRSSFSKAENPQGTEKSLDNTTESAEKPSNRNTYTDKISSATSAIADKAVSAKNAVASKIGYGEKGNQDDNKAATLEEEKIEDASDKSGSTLDYGKNIANTLTEKIAPVYGKVAEVGTAAKSKVSGTKTGDDDSAGGVGVEKAESVDKAQEKGASVKDYLAEKLKPGEEHKALSEVISETIYRPKKEEPKSASEDAINEKSDTVAEESNVNSPGKGVVSKIKGVVGSLFGNKSEENQSSQVGEGEDLLKNKNAGVEVEEIRQAEDERRVQE